MSTIKVGDMVTTRTGAGYEVVGIHGVQAWLRQPDYYITQPLDRLTKVEPKWEVGKTYRYRSGPKGTECTMLWVGGTYHEAIGVRAVNLGDEVTTTDQLVAFSPRDRYWYEEV